MPESSPKPLPSKPLPGKDDDAVERRTLRDYYIIMRERFWIALPLAVAVALLLGYYQLRQPKMYLSRATMEFEKPERVITTEGVVDPSVKSDIDLNTYLEDLNSESLRSKVLESFTPEEIKILQRPYLKNLAPGQPPPSLSGLLGNRTITSVRNSFLISVAVTHEDPEAAALIANRYVEQFVQYLLENVGGKNDAAARKHVGETSWLGCTYSNLHPEWEDICGNLCRMRRNECVYGAMQTLAV